jgi:streptogramin lyase
VEQQDRPHHAERPDHRVPVPRQWPELEGIAVGSDGNLWFTQRYVSEIGRITPGGAFSDFPLPSIYSEPTGMAAGSDGNVWFTEGWGNRIGRIAPDGQITEFTIPTAESRPERIAAAPDGSLWFTETYADKIGRITPSGAITEFPVPTEEARPWGIAVAPNGDIWFTEHLRDKVGRLTPAGEFTEYPLPGDFALPGDISPGPYGEMWLTEEYGNAIDRIMPDGRLQRFEVETVVPEPPYGVYSSNPLSIVLGPDGNMWFTEEYADRIGRISPGLPVPENLQRPAIEGEAQVGEQLLSTTGAWAREPSGYRYRWEACEPGGGTCEAIPGAEDSAYTVEPSVINEDLRVEVIASNQYGDGEPATSDMTAPVAAPPPPPPLPQPPPGGHPVPGGRPSGIRMTGSEAVVENDSVRLAIACVGDSPQETCEGMLSLWRIRKLGHRRPGHSPQLAHGRFALRTGDEMQVAMRLTRRGRIFFGRRRLAQVRAAAAMSGGKTETVVRVRSRKGLQTAAP